MYMYVYVCTCTCMYMYTYMYMYINLIVIVYYYEAVDISKCEDYVNQVDGHRCSYSFMRLKYCNMIHT